MSENRGPVIEWVTVVLGAVTAIAVTLRLWARAFIVKSLGADDGLICVATLFSWALAIVTSLAIRDGLGSHVDDILLRGEDNLLEYGRLVWMGTLLYNLSLTFTKLSILALYMRLGDVTLNRLSIFMCVVVVCHTIVSMVCITLFFPAQTKHDNGIVVDAPHLKIDAFYLSVSVLGVVTDIATYALPLRLITKLQIPRRQKVGLAVTLCLGFVACVSSIIRITFLPGGPARADPTWLVAKAVEWSIIEVNVGILAASIPSFKSIAKRYAPYLLGSPNEEASKSTSGSSLSRFLGRSRVGNRPAVELSTFGERARRPTAAINERGASTVVVNSSEEALYAAEPWA